ncbi:APC family permease [Haliangium sp.]|uniref:APC family permease n=1 Tax=Haliangium sp. TaxID=2663208 RepID=UPI003D125287
MSRRIEFAEYVAISAGMALSASCYAMVAGMFRFVAGFEAILAVGAAAALCMLVSSPVAELASRFPAAPGINTYLKAAFGERVSLPVVLLYIGLVAVFGGVESYVFSEVMAQLFPEVSRYLLVSCLLGGIVVINLFGIEIPRKLQLYITVFLLAGMLIISLWALMGPGSLPTPDSAAHSTEFSELPNAIALAVFLFVGFEWVTPLGRRSSSYERLVPLSMPVAIVLLGGVYMLFVAALDARLPRATIEATAIPQFALSTFLNSTTGAYLAASLSVFAMLSSFNAGLMSAARLVYSLAREGSLPRWCAIISFRSGAPMGAIALLGAVALAAGLLVLHFRVHLVAATIGAGVECILYGALLVACLRLRRTQPDKKLLYRSRVPAPVQWTLVVALAGLGVAALFSAPGPTFLAPGVFLALSLLAVLGATWSLRSRPNRLRARK